MRHADSDTPSYGRDHDRPISSQGKAEAAQIARLLQEKGWVPDVVLASNARRTKQTLEEMSNVMEGLGDVDTHLYGSLYTVAALDGQTRQHIEVRPGKQSWQQCMCRCHAGMHELAEPQLTHGVQVACHPGGHAMHKGTHGLHGACIRRICMHPQS